MIRLFHMVMFYTHCRIIRAIYNFTAETAGDRPAAVTISRDWSLDIKKRYI